MALRCLSPSLRTCRGLRSGYRREGLAVELQNRIIGVVGRKGSGKSTLARRILERCPRLFVFDTMGEHKWVPNGFRDMDRADEFLAWAEMQDRFAGRYIPEGDIAGDFADLADMVYAQGGDDFRS